MPNKQDRIFLAMIIVSLVTLSATVTHNSFILTGGNAMTTKELKAKFASYGLPLHPAQYWITK